MLTVGFGGGAVVSGCGACVGALSPANKSYFFGVPGGWRWRCRGGAGAEPSTADDPPMRIGTRLRRRREVSGLLLCKRGDDLSVPMGCFFRAIVVGGAGSGVVGDEI